MEEKKLFINLLKTTKRAGIENVINYLEETDFYVAPASSKYHLSCESGLIKHSLNVYYNLKKICNCNYDESTLIIVSLLHDICKVNTYEKSTKNIKQANGKWSAVQTYIVNDKMPLGHGEKSIILIQKFIKLSDDEITAIRWHMGGFEPRDNHSYMNNAFNHCKLAVLLHTADLKATYLDEIE